MAISDEKYVSLTTLRKSGAPVSSPVWIVALGDGTSGFTTDATSGKVKRIRNNAKVTLRPCNARGKVQEGAEEVAAAARVVSGAEAARVEAAIKKKYGFMVTVMTTAQKVVTKLRRKPSERAAIVLAFG